MSKARIRRFLAVASALVVLATLALCGAQIRKSTALETRVNRFRSIHIALLNYESAHGYVPPATVMSESRPVHSWRFLLVPYVRSHDKEVRFDVPWDSPENKIWRKEHDAFCDGAHGSRTCIVTVAGPGAPLSGQLSLPEIPAETILFIEFVNSPYHWMEPRDLDLKQFSDEMFEAQFTEDFLVMFADGEIWKIDHRVPFSLLRKFFGVDQTGDREELRKYKS